MHRSVVVDWSIVSLGIVSRTLLIEFLVKTDRTGDSNFGPVVSFYEYLILDPTDRSTDRLGMKKVQPKYSKNSVVVVSKFTRLG